MSAQERRPARSEGVEAREQHDEERHEEDVAAEQHPDRPAHSAQRVLVHHLDLRRHESGEQEHRADPARSGRNEWHEWHEPNEELRGNDLREDDKGRHRRREASDEQLRRAVLTLWQTNLLRRTKLTVLDFKIEIVLLIGMLLIAILGPLVVFLPNLAEAKRQGRRKYGLLAAQYTQAFERKWIKGEADVDEPLLGTADIQSLADLANSYEQVQATRLLPFGMAVVSHLVMMTALPLLPLVFSVLSLDSIIMRLFKILI